MLTLTKKKKKKKNTGLIQKEAKRKKKVWRKGWSTERKIDDFLILCGVNLL